MSYPASFQAYLSENWTINVHSAVPWDMENLDNGSYFDTGTGRWTPPAGLVLLHAAIQVAPDETNDGVLYVQIYKNDGANVSLSSGVFIPHGTTALSAFVEFLDVANGEDEYYVVTDYAGTAVGGNLASYFDGVLLSPA